MRPRDTPPPAGHGTTGPLRSGFAVLSVAVAVSLTAPAQASNRPTVPSVESWAPGAFDGACPAIGAVTYRVDATVLLPLLVTAVPVTSRANVGIATFAVYDCTGTGDARLLALEFFAGSFPERARGLNRLGFLREVVRFGHSGRPQGTAHFGVITANRERSVEQATRALDQHAGTQPYDIIDGQITPGGASNTVTQTTLGGRWTSAGELFRAVQPIWAGTPPTYERTLPNAGGQTFGPPVGFLGAIQISLRALLGGADRQRRRVPVVYVHNGRAFALDASAMTADRGQTRTLAQQGVVSPSAVVHRVTYRILDDSRREVETFRVWVERPAPGVADPLAQPLVPVAFEFRPRSFLELRAVRAAGACDAAQAPPHRAPPCDAPRTARR